MLNIIINNRKMRIEIGRGRQREREGVRKELCVTRVQLLGFLAFQVAVCVQSVCVCVQSACMKDDFKVTVCVYVCVCDGVFCIIECDIYMPAQRPHAHFSHNRHTYID